MALRDPVAQRVHDQPQHARVHGVEAVARAREVHVAARVVGHQAVVRRVVDALEREHRAEVVALGRVVVDHVEDDLDAGAVERLHHPLELLDLLPLHARRGVAGVRGEEADRGVAPVVRQTAVVEEALVDDVVHREQLDRGHAELLEVRDRLVRGQARVGAAQVLAHAGVQLREAAHVQLVDDRLVPRRLELPVALPVEARVDDDAARHRRGVVGEVGHGVVLAGDVRMRVAGVPAHAAVDHLGVGVEQQLRGVEAMAVLGRVRAVDAEAVALPGADAGEVAVPVEGRALRQLEAALGAVGVEQAQLDALRVLGEHGEVRTRAVPRRTQRERPSRPDVRAGASAGPSAATGSG